MLEDAYKDAESLITRMDEFKLNARVDQEVLAQITANFDILTPIHKEISDLIKLDENDKVYIVFDTKYLPMFEKNNDMLVEISGQQMERAQIQNDTAHKAMSNGRIILISTVIVAFIVVLIVMAALRKAILTPVDEIRIAAQALSQGATEQASSIEELSASITEITDQINKNAENAKQANDSAEHAGREIMNSNEQMRSMVEAMDEITVKSSEISKIIKVIDDIAFQTNILALNAAVEAARAGAAGKGFAVVADEVRNLASKSAEAAKGTTVLIEESIAAVQSGSEIARRTAEMLDESANVTRQAVSLIEKITEASIMQAESAAQINVGVEQISSVVQTNSATSEESAAASEELSGQAELLKSLVGKFRLREMY